MSLQTPLIDISISLPVKYSTEWSFSEDNLQKNIEEVAAFVSEVYAKFPKLGKEEREHLRVAGFNFDRIDDWPSASELPSVSECEEFKIALKNRIIADLNQEKASKLSTQYQPETTLHEVVHSVFQKQDYLYLLFPQKTLTRINLNSEKTKLRLAMNFK